MNIWRPRRMEVVPAGSGSAQMQDIHAMERRGLLLDSVCDVGDEEENDGTDYDAAITATEYGWFHYVVVLVGGFANASDAIELLCVSILLPAAECDLEMTSADKGWLSAMPFIGMMIGGYIWGCLGDMYGRRNVLIFSLLVNGLAGLISAFTQNFIPFLFFRFISGIGVGGSIPLVWAYVSEFQPGEKRGGALSVVASFWMVGNVLVAALALATIPFDIGFEGANFSYNSWRIFLTLCAFPAIIIAIVLLWMPESPMFLLLQGRQDEALVVLQNIYHRNTKRSPHSYPVKALSAAGMRVQTESTHNCWNFFTSMVKQTGRQTLGLFGRSLKRITIIMLVINFTIQFGYYGLWLWFPELFNRLEQYYNEHPDDEVSVCSLTDYSGNSSVVESHCESGENPVDPQALVNILISSAAPLPTNLWTIFYMDRLGRIFFLVFSMVLSGMTAFCIYFVKTATHNLVLSCIFGAVSTMGFNALDCLGTELFPTQLRSTALAVTLLAARIGAIFGNLSFGYLLDTYCAVPMFLVAFLLISGGAMGLLLPNTTRTALS